MSKSNIITVTEAAQTRIKEIFKKNPEKYFFLGLKKGGCAGMEYDIQLCDTIPNNSDPIKIADDLTIYIAREAILFLLGTSIDFETTVLRTGFIFNNPNQISACGCGESVMLKPKGLSQT